MTLSLEDIADDPTMEERVQFPLFLVEEQGETKEDIRKRIEDTIEYADAVVVGDSDSDGLGCVALVQAKHKGENVVYIPAGHRGIGFDIGTAMMFAKDAPEDAPVYLVDLSPDDESEEGFVGFCRFVADTHELYIRDHHDWSDDVVDELEDVATSIVIEEGKCATELVCENDLEDPDEKYEEFAYVTSINDLWKEDLWDEEPRYADLKNYAFWSDTHRDYIDVVVEHGADIRDDPEVGEMLSRKIPLKEDKIEYQVNEESDMMDVSVDAWGGQTFTIAFSYGTAYGSEVGHRLIDKGADVAIIVKPLKEGKVSVRASEDAPFATAIAQEFGGNGHPEGTTGGFETGLVKSKSDVTKDDPAISFYEHWKMKGGYVKSHVYEKLPEVLEKRLTDDYPDEPIEGVIMEDTEE